MQQGKQRLALTWFNKDQAIIPSERGRYGYQWVDPADPRYCETHTLIYDDYVAGHQADKDSSTTYGPRADLEPTTDNLLVLGESGDVLEALTRVPELAEKYVGQVKCIYIDPPFNTAQTFEHYEDNLEHSIWLTMMRDRLLHMRKLLHEDGSIWVHLDDAEVHRMRVLLDEIFGAANFIAQVAWEKVSGRDNRSVMSKTCDTILVYSRDRNRMKATRNLLPRNAARTAVMYGNPDNDPRGPWTSDNFSAQAGHGTPDQVYTLITPAGNHFDPPPGRCWLFTEARYNELLADNRVWFGASGGNAPRLKRFLSEVQDGLVPKTLWTREEVGTNDTAKKENLALLPVDSPFSTPKPERLLERIIEIATNPGELVLDVFAGSGTTAAVAHKMGRRWVTCELMEETFDSFTRPRLEKVVNGTDPGGVTAVKGARVDAAEEGLPEGFEPEDAAELTRLLNKAFRESPEWKNNPGVKAIKAAVKTRRIDAVNWLGGGGFQLAHLSPACFDFDPRLGMVMLTDDAAGETLNRSVAAQLGYRLTPQRRQFVGVKGSSRLAVLRTPLTPELAVELAGSVDEGERVTIAATSIVDGSRQALREASSGARVLHIPDDLFRIGPEGGQR